MFFGLLFNMIHLIISLGFGKWLSEKADRENGIVRLISVRSILLNMEKAQIRRLRH